MLKRSYGQYCGFARAVESLGERWALLIIRDLLNSPKRFTDLHRGLAGVPTNVLTARLKELESAGIIRRNVLPSPERGVAYELTEYGAELEEIVLRLGRWGAKTLGDPRPGEVVTVDSMIMALRTIFRPEAARNARVTFELRMGDIVIHARVNEGNAHVAKGPAPHADLVIEGGPAIKQLLSGERTAADAIASGSVKVHGDPHLLARFAEYFQISA